MASQFVPTCFKHKLDLQQPSSKLYQRKEELTRLRNQGWSIDRLAGHFGMTRSGIYSALVRLGLTGVRVPRSKWSRGDW
jgi:hypothetical protein